MSFNPDISKQAQEVIFSKTNANALHPFLYLNRTPVIHCSHQKHLDFYQDKKLSFHQHLEKIITRASKGMSVIRKLSNVLPRKASLTLYKSLVRPWVFPNTLICHFLSNED